MVLLDGMENRQIDFVPANKAARGEEGQSPLFSSPFFSPTIVRTVPAEKSGLSGSPRRFVSRFLNREFVRNVASTVQGGKLIAGHDQRQDLANLADRPVWAFPIGPLLIRAEQVRNRVHRLALELSGFAILSG